MSRFFIFLWLVLFWLQAGAQSRKTDSLRQLLHTHSGTKRVDVLNAYAYAVSSYNFSVAQKSLEEAYALSTQLKYKHGLAEALLYKGIIESNIGHDSLSMVLFRKCLAYADNTKDKQLRGRAFTAVGLAFQNADQSDSSDYFYQQAYLMLKDSVSPLNLSFLYLNMGELYGIKNNQQLQLKFLKRSWEIRRKLGEHHALVWTGVALSSYYTQDGDFTKAMSYLNLCTKALGNDTTDSEEIAIIHKQKGVIYASLGKHTAALDLFYKARKYYERNPYAFDLVKLLIEVGFVQGQVANYETSLKYYFQALRLAEANDYQMLVTQLYSKIARVYYLMEQNDLAEDYSQKSYAYAVAHRHELEEAYVLNLMGLLAARKEQYQKALDYYNRALELRSKNHYGIGVAGVLGNIGELYEKKGEFNKAEEFSLKSLALTEETNYALGKCYSYQSIGKLYLRKKDYGKALRYLDQGEEFAKKINYLDVLAGVYKLKQNLWRDQSDYKRAIVYSERYEKLKDSLFNSNVANRILTLQHDFDLDKKENEIKILNQQKQLQQNTLELQKSQITAQRTVIIVGVIISVSIAAIAIIIFGYYKKVKRLNFEIHERSEEINAQAEELRETNEALGNLNKEISEQKEEIQAQAEELTESNQTIARINESLEDKIRLRTSELKEAYHELDTFLYRSSHDFRRPLTTFMGLAEVAKVSVKETAALELFEKVKETANNLDKMLGKLQSVNLVSTAGMQSEIDFKSIFESEMHLFQNELLRKKIIVTTQVDVAEPISSYPVLLKVVVQNLLENAITFSGDEKPYILLSVCIINGEIRLQVSDNGQGIDAPYLPRIYEMYFRANEKSSGNGLGLYIVKKMVDKLSGRIEIESELGKGTTVKIFLPHSIN